MHVTHRASAPVRRRDGLTSQILLQAGDVGSDALAVTWVEIEPGGRQALHSHAPEQVYVVVRGRGRMHVAGEEREVGAGDLVRIPPHAAHGLVNEGDEPLVYVSAATPAFAVTGVYDGAA